MSLRQIMMSASETNKKLGLEIPITPGQPSRVQARFEKNKKRFKDNAQLEYAHEELIAEIGAVLLSQRFNMQQTINNNNLAYLKSWISALENDNKFLISALSQSYRASEFLLNEGKIKEYPEQLRKVA